MMDLLTTKQMAKRMGLNRHQFVYLMDSGQIPDSTIRISNRRAFTEDEFNQACDLVREIRAKQSARSGTSHEKKAAEAASEVEVK